MKRGNDGLPSPAPHAFMLAMASYAETGKSPRTLTEREQKLLLKVTGEHRAGFRDHCLYAMALGTGLREHELIALSVGDVFREGRPRRRLLLSVFKGAGKAGGTQEVLLSESLRGKLRRFRLVLSTEELISPRRFKRRFVEKLRRIPRLPGRRAEITFEDHVNAWLDSAEVVHQPPEASRRNLVKDEIVRLVDGLGTGESTDDLDHGMALDVDGWRAFKSRTLMGAGRESPLADIGTHELCGLLRELGCFAKAVWRDGKTVRVWIAPAEWPAAATTGEHIDGEEGQSIVESRVPVV
jgi:hypothetical protein